MDLKGTSYQNAIKDLEWLPGRDPERVAIVRQTNETSEMVKKEVKYNAAPSTRA